MVSEWTISGSLIIAYLVYAFLNGIKGSKEPPGPRRIPIIGNLLPPVKPWFQMAKWTKEFGGVYSLRILSTPAVVIGNVEAAHELLEAKSIYWGRKPPKMVELCEMHKGVLYENDATRFKKGRKLIASILQPRELQACRPVLHEQVVHFLNNLLKEPSRFLAHIRNIPAGVTLEMSYGYKIKKDRDPLVQEANITVKNYASASALAPNETFAVNWLPFLTYLPSWFPGTGFKKTAVEYREQSLGLLNAAHQTVLDAMANGTARDSMTLRAITDTEDRIEDDIIKHNAAQVFTGGADTSISNLSSFILAMVQNPDVQRKAQEEIDRVVGNDRLPDISDRPNLPYIEAIMRENIRKFSVIPTVYRNPVEDDTYRGYRIAKGTTVLVNFWGMLNDDNVHQDPGKYNPDRWFNTTIDKSNDPYEIAFGFGRRACPGKHLALEMLFKVMSNTLAVFDIKPIIGTDGKAKIPPGYFTNGSIIAPQPFECSIVPRSDKARELIEHELNALSS